MEPFSYLAGHDWLEMPVVPPSVEDHAWHHFAVTIAEEAPTDRDTLAGTLAEAGVETSIHYRPLHRMTHWRRTCDADERSFPGAERRWRGTLSLPIFPSMTHEEVDWVCGAVGRALSSRAVHPRTASVL